MWNGLAVELQFVIPKLATIPIDFVAERGGGKITFPYAPKGYRIAAPGRETWKGRACRAQLCIPAQPGLNIAFEGEMPCKLLYSYQVRPKNCAAVFAPTRFGTMGMPNTCLFSDWASAVTNAAERPWAILAAAEGTSCASADVASAEAAGHVISATIPSSSEAWNLGFFAVVAETKKGTNIIIR